MLRSECKVGQLVYFGRTNGQKTLGRIERLNPMKAKVKTLEARGCRAQEGTIWSVPYSMMTVAEGKEATPPKPEPLTYSPFTPISNLILEALLHVYNGLSPENLTCDGELSASQINRKRSELERQRKGLIAAFGREVSETEVYAWDAKRRQASLQTALA